MRWSMANSRLILPVAAGKAYEFEMELSVPKLAESPETGLYLDGKLVTPIKPGASNVGAQLPPVSADRMVLELRCRGWVPRESEPGSKDGRTLGVSVSSLRMRAKGGGTRLFDANTGEWVP
jgi:hypothetical protein